MDKTEEKGTQTAKVAQAPQDKTNSEDYFADFDLSKVSIDLESLLKNGAHFGHQKARKDPRMDEYIFTTRRGISIFDLEKTLEKIEEAAKFLKEIKSSGKQIVFVGTKKQLQDVVKSAAKRCAMPYVIERWLGGTFTNFRVIRTRAKYLNEGQGKMEKGEYQMYTKLERLKMSEELEKLERKMGGIKEMAELPGAIFVTDIKQDELAVKEAVKMNIPVVAIVDSNCNPGNVDYPIPANDDAVSSVRLILAYICKTLTE